MPFPAPLPAPEHLSRTSTAREYILAYLAAAGLSQNRLAKRVRQTQQRINNIIGGKCKNVDVATIVAICLVLGLDKYQSFDLLSRFERALSPANPAHRAFEELIDIYSEMSKEENFFEESRDEELLDKADEYLESAKTQPLPNIYA